MFGFIKPVKAELRVREVERFQSVYCGLCHEIKRRYGRFHTLFLSYDMTFMALVLCCVEPDEAGTLLLRCDASPLRKRCTACASPGISRAADVSVLLSHHKLRDTIDDERGPKRLAARLLQAMGSRGYRRASVIMPHEEQTALACLDALHELEIAHTASLDRPADTFARLLAACVPATGDEQQRVLQQLFYHMGRWVYLIDACADLRDDLRSGAYNPVALRYELSEPCLDPVKQALEITLQRSLADIHNAFQLLTVYRDRELIENIICLGLPTVTRQVLDGTYQSNGGQNRHGSL